MATAGIGSFVILAKAKENVGIASPTYGTLARPRVETCLPVRNKARSQQEKARLVSGLWTADGHIQLEVPNKRFDVFAQAILGQ